MIVIGTTSIVSILDHGTLYVANVGDSRAVMCDQHLEAIPLSYDHKPDSVSPNGVKYRGRS